MNDPDSASAPFEVSPGTGPRHGRPRLTHDESGNPYVAYIQGTYHPGDDADWPTIQLYSAAQGDPTLEANWTRGIALTPAVRTWACDAFLLVRNDTLQTIYSSLDDDDGDDGDAEVWYQRGHLLSDGVDEGEKVIWPSRSQIALACDFVIAEAGTLLVEPGVTVWAASHFDSHDQGRYPSKIEIINRGVMLVQGTQEDPVTFRSTEGGIGDWGGIWFNLEGCNLCGGWGFSASLTGMSRMEHVHIEDATEGIGIGDFEAPSLSHVTFADIENDRHIYVDSTDVFIPYATFTDGWCDEPYTVGPGEWDLPGGTRVVVANATRSGRDFDCVGEEGKVDLVFDGPLTTTGSFAAGDSTYFLPEYPTDESLSSAAQDWGGIFLSYYSAGSSIDYADMGYAANPLYLYYPTGTPVRHTRIHHFADTGLWSWRHAGSQGPDLDSLVVERGPSLHPSLGDVGVLIDESPSTELTRSTISLVGRNGTSPGAAGVIAYFTSAYCGTATTPAEPFTISNNLIEGPGLNISNGVEDSGIVATRLCSGGVNRPVDIVGNTVHGWKKVGMFLDHSKNLPVGCNVVTECLNGIDIVRGDTQTGTMRFRDNRVEATRSNTNYFALRTNDALWTDLGPDNEILGTGINQLAVNVQDTKFIIEEDVYPASSNTDTLNARENYWFTYTDTPTPAFTLITVDSSIVQRIAPDTALVDFGAYITSDPSGYPLECSPPSPSASRRRGFVAAPGGDSPSPLDASAMDVPTQQSLGPPRPNPGRDGIAVDLSVPANRVGKYELSVFDVRGRRVFDADSFIMQAGRYVVEWRGVDVNGRPASPGIYFLRVTGPGNFREIRKAVRLR